MTLRKITESIAVTLARLSALTVLPIVAIKYIGDEAYGVVAFLSGWITLIVMVAPIGHDNLLLRNLQRYLLSNDRSKLLGLRNQSYITTSLFSVIALLIFICILALHEFVSQTSLGCILLFLPLMSLSYLSSFVIQGIGKTTIASIIRGPGPIVAIILLLYVFNKSNWMIISGIELFFGLYVLVYGTMTPFVFYYAIRLTRSNNERVVKASYDTMDWVKDGLWLLLFSFSFIVLQQIDILMIGSILGTEAISSYQVASKLVTLLTVGLLAVNIYIPPTISKLYAEGDMAALQRIFLFSVSGSVLVFIFVWLLLICFFDDIISYTALDVDDVYILFSILCTGQLINVLSGSCGFSLTMTGHHRFATKVNITMVIINIVLNVILIHLFGTVGAAIATAISISLSNITMVIYSIVKIGIDPGISALFHVKNYYGRCQ